MVDAATPPACGLCGGTEPLQNSHIIPAFVGKWIKDTSATGFMRGYEVPNRRAQDLPTRRLLCAGCEGRLSKAENAFSQFIFKPFLERGRSTFEYDRWLLDFAVSLAWRCLATSDPASAAVYPQHGEAIADASEAMRNYLLGRSEHVKPYRFNLFFTPAGVTSSARLPEGMSWYSLRGADLTPVYSATRFATYVKLPGMFFWTSIAPPDPGGWRGTKIGRQGQFRSANQVLEEPGVFDFMLHRIETVYSRISNLSDAQRAKIDSAVLKNPDRAADSHSFEVWMDDERIRAENAAKRTV